MWQQIRILLVATVHFQMNSSWLELLISLLIKRKIQIKFISVKPRMALFFKDHHGFEILCPPGDLEWSSTWYQTGNASCVDTRLTSAQRRLSSVAWFRRAEAMNCNTCRLLSFCQSFTQCYTGAGVTEGFAFCVYARLHPCHGVCHVSHLCIAREKGTWASSEGLGFLFAFSFSGFKTWILFGWGDGSVGKGDCCQTWGSEFNLRAHLMEGENSLPQLPSAGYVCTMARAHPCTSTYRHKYAGKINLKTKQKLWHCCSSDISEQSVNRIEANHKYKTEYILVQKPVSTCVLWEHNFYRALLFWQKICYFKVLQSDTWHSHVLYVPNSTKTTRHGGACL